MSATLLFLRRLTKRVWFRAALFTMFSIIVALAGGIVATWLPFSPAIELGQNSVGQILQILASSMLAVTTFSLTTMVTAYSSAATIATPRATNLLIEDRTAQNVLSTFVGAFAYSLVGIIALSTGYYSDQGRVVLFLSTLVVIVIIIVTILRWISHLQIFGRMSDVIERVEQAASRTLRTYAENPSLGARSVAVAPQGGVAIPAPKTGYVTHIDLATIERAASDANVEVHIVSTPGTMTDGLKPLARIVGDPGEETTDKIGRAFQVESQRTYEQDPRLGVIALSEIGSRALSPATNDPGTAIQALGALQRVFTAVLAQEPDEEVTYPHVSVTPVSFDDLIEDGFRPIARDGAGMVEVAIRLQKVLAALAVSAPAQQAMFRDAAKRAASRATASLSRPDAALLRDTRRGLWH